MKRWRLVESVDAGSHSLIKPRPSSVTRKWKGRNSCYLLVDYLRSWGTGSSWFEVTSNKKSKKRFPSRVALSVLSNFVVEKSGLACRVEVG